MDTETQVPSVSENGVTLFDGSGGTVARVADPIVCRSLDGSEDRLAYATLVAEGDGDPFRLRLDVAVLGDGPWPFCAPAMAYGIAGAPGRLASFADPGGRRLRRPLQPRDRRLAAGSLK